MPGCVLTFREVVENSEKLSSNSPHPRVQWLSQPHAGPVMAHLLKGFSLGDGMCRRGVKALRK